MKRLLVAKKVIVNHVHLLETYGPPKPPLLGGGGSHKPPEEQHDEQHSHFPNLKPFFFSNKTTNMINNLSCFGSFGGNNVLETMNMLIMSFRGSCN